MPTLKDVKIGMKNKGKSRKQRMIPEFLTNGWWDLEAQNGTLTRWMENNGTIEVISPLSRYYTVNFTVGTEISNKTLTVFVNGKLLGYLPVQTAEPFRYLMSVFLREGVNELTFFCEQSFVPAKSCLIRWTQGA